LIVGDGPARASIEAAVRREGLTGKVTITGRQPHTGVRRFVAAMDVAVSPRATRYASPMKLVEYMAAGKAVVAPDMPNIRDLIAPDVTGALFQAESADSMAAAIDRLLADPALRAQLGTAARASVEQRRNWRHNARSVIEIGEMACTRAAAARS
jgi:glycosyltransferase involved in cell wall biosynthesis